MTNRDAFVATASALLDEQPAVALVLAAIGRGRFVETGAVSRHPERVIDVGIREQTMIGVAAGLALEGWRPIVHSYAPFLIERPYEQIKLDLAHQGLGAVLVSIGASVDAAGEGRTHQSPGDVGLLSTIPGVDVHVPGHPAEVDRLLRDAATTRNTVYIRLEQSTNTEPRPADGTVQRVRRGGDGAPTVLAIGPMLDPVLAAVRGLDFTVLYTSTVRPLDSAGLRTHTTGTDLAVVEPYLEGTTLPSIVGAFEGIPMSYRSIGLPVVEIRRYGTREEHIRAHGLDPGSLRRRLTGRMSSPMQVA